MPSLRERLVMAVGPDVSGSGPGREGCHHIPEKSGMGSATAFASPANAAIQSPAKTASARFMFVALSRLTCRFQSLEDEFLHAIALRFAGDDIALQIDVQAVQMEELTG